MPSLPLATQAYDRPSYGLPPARLVNMLVELGDTSDTGKVWFQRSGLKADFSVGTGPIRGIMLTTVGFIGPAFVVSGTQLYRGATLVGSVPSPLFPDLPVRMAQSSTQFVVVAEHVAYCDNAGVYGPITDPDLPSGAVLDAVILGGRFIYPCLGGKFYWSVIGDATSIDGLDFASAESDPDALKGAIVVNDSLYFLGEKTIERWVLSSDPDAPYQRITSGGYARGCASIYATVAIDNSFMWIGENRIVYRAGNVPVRISTETIEEKLLRADMDTVRAFKVFQGAHELYILNMGDQGTEVYDAYTKRWSSWESYERSLFRGRCAEAYENLFFGGLNGAKYWVGDDETGQVWVMDPDQYFDGTDTAITRIVSGLLKLPAGAQALKSVMLLNVRGVGNATDPGLDPQVEMRLSRDGGRTWGEWAARSLGKIGEYSKKAIWRALGQVRSPGIGVEFRCTDPVKFVVEGAVFNEPVL